jgi:hypothetical protein
MNVCTWSSIVLSITVLIVTGTCPLNAVTSDFGVGIFIPNCLVVLCKTYTALCKS